jgi:hypothetical protein
MTRTETWLAIAGAFVALTILYVELGRAIDAGLAWFRDRRHAGVIDGVETFNNAVTRAYFGAHVGQSIELPSGMTVTLTGVSGFDPDDVTIGDGSGHALAPIAPARRHLRLVDDVREDGAA